MTTLYEQASGDPVAVLHHWLRHEPEQMAPQLKAAIRGVLALLDQHQEVDDVTVERDEETRRPEGIPGADASPGDPPALETEVAAIRRELEDDSGIWGRAHVEVLLRELDASQAELADREESLPTWARVRIGELTEQRDAAEDAGIRVEKLLKAIVESVFLYCAGGDHDPLLSCSAFQEADKLLRGEGER